MPESAPSRDRETDPRCSRQKATAAEIAPTASQPSRTAKSAASESSQFSSQPCKADQRQKRQKQERQSRPRVRLRRDEAGDNAAPANPIKAAKATAARKKIQPQHRSERIRRDVACNVFLSAFHNAWAGHASGNVRGSNRARRGRWRCGRRKPRAIHSTRATLPPAKPRSRPGLMCHAGYARTPAPPDTDAASAEKAICVGDRKRIEIFEEREEEKRGRRSIKNPAPGDFCERQRRPPERSAKTFGCRGDGHLR